MLHQQARLFPSSTTRWLSPTALGLAAGLSVGAAAIVGAQSTTSQTRIPVTTKQAPGEVRLPRVDTVTIYRTDTTRVMMTDTVRVNIPGIATVDTVRLTVPGPTTVVTHYDTVAVNPPTLGGLYFGLGSGPSLQRGSLSRTNGTGAIGQFNVGWQGVNNFLGIRLDENYASYMVKDSYSSLNSHPVVWNTNLDAKLQIPGLTHLFGYAPKFTVYAIGGATYARYDNLRVAMNPGNTGFGPDNVNSSIIDGDWRGKWGSNYGAGVSFHWRATEIFAEARAIAFSLPGSPMADQVPITIGMNAFAWR